MVSDGARHISAATACPSEGGTEEGAPNLLRRHSRLSSFSELKLGLLTSSSLLTLDDQALECNHAD